MARLPLGRVRAPEQPGDLLRQPRLGLGRQGRPRPRARPACARRRRRGAGRRADRAGFGSTWDVPSWDAASMRRMCRASGRSVRTEMRGASGSAVAGWSMSVAARRTRRRRPSAKRTAMNPAPRAHASDSTFSRSPRSGWCGSTIVTSGTTRSETEADPSVPLGKYPMPFPEGLVGGDEQRAALVAGGDELEDDAGLGLVLGDVGDVVEDQQVVLVELGDGGLELRGRAARPAASARGRWCG